MNAEVAPNPVAELREASVINSALWAAAGDAIGWITELAREGTVQHRTGQEYISEPIPWTRTLGGRNGVRVNLPAGTYSDDTQLRLAVSRGIRSTGAFDAEAFARVELTVWQSYALGAGLGSKAAASNLTKRGVNWFSNFYSSRNQSYFAGGGNGAAMRIQPHVWASTRRDGSVELEVLKNALITHGHAHGIGGALFHALSLQQTIEEHAVPNIGSWFRTVDRLADAAELIANDRQLVAFWKPTWERESGKTLAQALSELRIETLELLDRIAPVVEEGPEKYREVLSHLGVLTPRFRGSGMRTAIAASAASWMFRDQSVEKLLASVANESESDTDTIATMAGAITGAVADRAPGWPLQDSDYILAEARRLARIARGERRGGFSYPDLAKWSPPSNQSDAIVRLAEGFALTGFGPVIPMGEGYASGDFVWQWFKLPFGQTVFAKRRRSLEEAQSVQQAPVHRRDDYGQRQPDLLQTAEQPIAARPPTVPERNRDWLSFATDRVVQSNFDDRVFGRFMNETVERLGIDGAVALAGILARQKAADPKRGRR